MCFCVDDKLVQRNEIGVITKQQIQVFECFCQVEGLHLVPVAGVLGPPDRVDGGVALFESGVAFEGSEDLPAPLLVFLIFGGPVHVEEALHGLWTLKVELCAILQLKAMKMEIVSTCNR